METKAFAIDLTMPKYRVGDRVFLFVGTEEKPARVVSIQLTFEGSLFWDHDGGMSSYVPQNVLAYTLELNDGTHVEAAEIQLRNIMGI